MPTASTYAANHAPADMRGRYMGFFSLSWGVASGVAPIFGGTLGEVINPQATWFGGAAVGLVSVVGFLVLANRERRKEQANI